MKKLSAVSAMGSSYLFSQVRFYAGRYDRAQRKREGRAGTGDVR